MMEVNFLKVARGITPMLLPVFMFFPSRDGISPEADKSRVA